MIRTTLIILTFILTSYTYGQTHLIDSTVHLSFGGEKIDCIKRYIDYEYGDLFGDDTIFYMPPKFYLYLFEDYERRNIKTAKHMEYGYTEDLETGELWISDKYEVDSIGIGKFLGEIDKDSLFQMLTSSISFIDTRDTFPVNMNYTIDISNKDTYVQVSAASWNYELILKYELNQLQKNDCVIIQGITFNSAVSTHPSHLNAGYWKIK